MRTTTVRCDQCGALVVLDHITIDFSSTYARRETLRAAVKDFCSPRCAINWLEHNA